MNKDSPFTLSSFPRAILHVDGDAFFTSVEQSMHPHLKGRPLVTGKERGIIACASYEAKALGIKRGVSLWKAREMCPGLVVLPSDYESYSLYSKRMFEIMRRYTPEVEEYSIDEGFADITGMRRLFRRSYKEIGLQLQDTIHKELDLTVSVGLSLSKSLAKIASDYRKPNGITAVRGKHIHLFLQRIPLAEVWGIGPSAQGLLGKYGIKTAYDFTQMDEKRVRKMLHKPGWEIWQELRGHAVKKLEMGVRSPQASIMKGKTFSASSSDRNYVYAKLIRNLESSFIKLRRHQMRAREVAVYIRRKDYDERGVSARFNRSTSNAMEITALVEQMFNKLYVEGTEYRSTMVVLTRLDSDLQRQCDLFEDRIRIERMREVGQVVDRINRRYGKHRIFLGTGLALDGVETNDRDEPCWRRLNLLEGETRRKRVRLPRLNLKI
jgi:nucleotidyltransferase/DNA polymerase involved in DNA repair